MRSRRSTLLVGALLGVALLVAVQPVAVADDAAPAVIEVAPGQSLSNALARIASGGTILLLAGTHSRATAGPRAWDATVTVRPADDAAGRVYLGQLNLRGFENLTITGVRMQGLVTIDGGHAVTVASSQLRGVLVKGATSDITVRDNDITGGWNGVTVQSWRGSPRPHDVHITGNRITGQVNDNIQIGVAHDVTVEDNVLWNPQKNDNHNDGVQFMGGQRLVVRGNRFSGQDQAMMLKPETYLGADSAVVDALIEDNLVHNTRGFGIILRNTVRTTLRSNTVYDIPKQSLLFTGANSGATVVSNVAQSLYVERNATAPATETGNCIALGGTAADIQVVAQFVDRVDYQLVPGSACSGFGWTLPR